MIRSSIFRNQAVQAHSNFIINNRQLVDDKIKILLQLADQFAKRGYYECDFDFAQVQNQVSDFYLFATAMANELEKEELNPVWNGTKITINWK